jgi:hypothetical protein
MRRWAFSGLWIAAGLCLAISASSDPSASAQSRAVSHGSDTFDLAVVDVEVTQVSSTAMFREVQVRCQVENRGPEKALTRAWVVVSREADDGDKVLNKVPVPVPFPSGNFVTATGNATAWSANSFPYRCSLAFDGDGGDADPSDDVDQVIFPKE